MLTDYHNHLETGTLSYEYMKKFIDEANRKRIDTFGISEHAYHFFETANILSNPWVNPRRFWSMDEYIKVFHEAWNKGERVLFSIEMDYQENKHEEMKKFIEAYPFDYVIGSVHWNDDFGIDLKEYKQEWEKRDLYQIYTRYYDQIVTLAQSNLFDIVGHIDLVKIFKYIPQDKEFLLECYDRATDALKESKTCVEISTAGLRKPIGELYPDKTLLQMCYDKKIPIVLSSDAHFPEDVGKDYDKAIQLATEVGYKELVVFGNGNRINCPIG